MPPQTSTIDPAGWPRGPRIALIVSSYSQWITGKLAEGAEEAFRRAAGNAADGDAWSLVRCDAPGTYELPALASAAIQSGRFDAVVCLGCVIKGETSHDHHIASAVAHALQELAVRSAPTVPIGFGVITADTADQAEARAGGSHGNKGAEAMDAALASLGIVQAMGSQG